MNDTSYVVNRSYINGELLMTINLNINCHKIKKKFCDNYEHCKSEKEDYRINCIYKEPALEDKEFYNKSKKKDKNMIIEHNIKSQSDHRIQYVKNKKQENTQILKYSKKITQNSEVQTAQDKENATKIEQDKEQNAKIEKDKENAKENAAKIAQDKEQNAKIEQDKEIKAEQDKEIKAAQDKEIKTAQDKEIKAAQDKEIKAAQDKEIKAAQDKENAAKIAQDKEIKEAQDKENAAKIAQDKKIKEAQDKEKNAKATQNTVQDARDELYAEKQTVSIIRNAQTAQKNIITCMERIKDIEIKTNQSKQDIDSIQQLNTYINTQTSYLLINQLQNIKDNRSTYHYNDKVYNKIITAIEEAISNDKKLEPQRIEEAAVLAQKRILKQDKENAAKIAQDKEIKAAQDKEKNAKAARNTQQDAQDEKYAEQQTASIIRNAQTSQKNIITSMEQIKDIEIKTNQSKQDIDSIQKLNTYINTQTSYLLINQLQNIKDNRSTYHYNDKVYNKIINAIEEAISNDKKLEPQRIKEAAFLAQKRILKQTEDFAKITKYAEKRAFYIIRDAEYAEKEIQKSLRFKTQSTDINYIKSLDVHIKKIEDNLLEKQLEKLEKQVNPNNKEETEIIIKVINKKIQEIKEEKQRKEEKEQQQNVSYKESRSKLAEAEQEAQKEERKKTEAEGVESVSKLLKCGFGRLRQFAGTCWFNSALNSFFLVPQIRNLFLDKWYLYGISNEDEKKKIETQGFKDICFNMSFQKSIYTLIYNLVILEKKVETKNNNNSNQKNFIAQFANRSQVNSEQSVNENLNDQKGGYPINAAINVITNLFTPEECIIFTSEFNTFLYTKSVREKLINYVYPKFIINKSNKPEIIEQDISNDIYNKIYTNNNSKIPEIKISIPGIPNIILVNSKKDNNTSNIKVCKKIKVNEYTYKCLAAVISFQINNTSTIHGHHAICGFVCNDDYLLYDANNMVPIINTNWWNGDISPYTNYISTNNSYGRKTSITNHRITYCIYVRNDIVLSPETLEIRLNEQLRKKQKFAELKKEKEDKISELKKEKEDKIAELKKKKEKEEKEKIAELKKYEQDKKKQQEDKKKQLQNLKKTGK